MIVTPQKVRIKKISKQLREWFEFKGYDSTSKKELVVDVSDLKPQSNIEVYFSCDECGCTDEKRAYKRLLRNKHHFCGNDSGRNCCAIFKEKENAKKRILCECHYCGNSYPRTTYQFNKNGSKFCKIRCRNRWESENKQGVNHHNYARVRMKCDYCETPFDGKKYKLKSNQKNFFCSKDCRIDWYREVWSQSEEWREKSRKRTVTLRAKGIYSRKGNNVPHTKVNNMLKKLNIKYEDETPFQYYNADCYLYEQNLVIEVQGTYWHGDPRFFKEINHEQASRIQTDIKKREYMMKYFNIKILYLWEYEINHHPELCLKLIDSFVNNNGNIKNEHSFNYLLIDGELSLSSTVTKPYTECLSFIERGKITKQNSFYIISSKRELNKKTVFEALSLSDMLKVSSTELKNLLSIKKSIAIRLVEGTTYKDIREEYLKMDDAQKEYLFHETIKKYDILNKHFTSAQSYTPNKVFHIVKLIQENVAYKEIAQEFNLAISTIKKIADGRIYKKITRLYQLINSK